jgi:hypothetical protein
MQALFQERLQELLLQALIEARKDPLLLLFQALRTALLSKHCPPSADPSTVLQALIQALTQIERLQQPQRSDCHKPISIPVAQARLQAAQITGSVSLSSHLPTGDP